MTGPGPTTRRMALRIATLLCTGGLALLTTTGMAQDVTYDYDRTADFSRITTYAWDGGGSVSDPLNHRRIVAAVDSQLAAKGLTKVPADADPDVVITYRAALTEDLEITGTGYGRYAGLGRNGNARVERVYIGTLLIGMFDGKTRALVWRGTASRELDLGASPQTREKHLKQATQKLFKKYPPSA
jgi:hypothetical protein